MAPMGGVVALRLEAIKTAMELYKVENQIECVKKINVISEEMFRKDE